MEINFEKLRRQQEGKEKWRRAGGKGTLWYEMGVGKTYTAILIMKDLFEARKEAIVYLVLPTDILKKQWTKELKLHLKDFLPQIKLYTNTEILFRQRLDDCTLLIVDEIHEFVEGNKFGIISKHFFNYQFILGLTGTWAVKDNLQRNLIPYCPIVDRIDQEEARENNFIATIIEYNVPIQLTPTEREKYEYYNAKIEEFRKIFNEDFLLALNCIKGASAEQFRIDVAKNNGWTPEHNERDINKRQLVKKYNPNNIFRYAVDFVAIVGQRVQLVYKATNKVNVVIKLCEKYPVKTIIFSENTEFADRIFHELNYQLKSGDLFTNHQDDICAIYHSNIETRIENINGKDKKVGKVTLKKRAIDNIISGVRRILVTSKALNSGTNIPDLRMGVNVSSTQSKNQHEQRNGRINRLEIDNPNVVVLMVNIYAQDTIEERWLRNKQRGGKNVIKFVSSIDQINHVFDKK